jgi:hypothetical protein
MIGRYIGALAIRSDIRRGLHAVGVAADEELAVHVDAVLRAVQRRCRAESMAAGGRKL